MKRFLLLVLVFGFLLQTTSIFGASGFEIRSLPDQPHATAFVPGHGTLFVAAFILTIGNEDLYGDGVDDGIVRYDGNCVIGGHLQYTPTNPTNNDGWFQWVASVDIVGTNGPCGNWGYARMLSNGLVESAWVSYGTTIFPKNSTNLIYVALGMDWGADFQPGDTLTFTSSNFCKLKDATGVTVYATGSVSNTVTVINGSRLDMTVSKNITTFHATVPSRYEEYKLEESADLVNWSVIPETSNLERVMYMGDFQFTLYETNRSGNRFFRLRP